MHDMTCDMIFIIQCETNELGTQTYFVLSMGGVERRLVFDSAGTSTCLTSSALQKQEPLDVDFI